MRGDNNQGGNGGRQYIVYLVLFSLAISMVQEFFNNDQSSNHQTKTQQFNTT